MLAYDLKKILELAPEAHSLVKEAALTEEFPTGSRDSVCASYLRAQYLAHNQDKFVDPTLKETLTKAASLYGVKDKLDEISKSFSKKELEKSAQETLLEKMALFEEHAYGFHQPAKAARLAEELVSHTDREDVRRYAGKAFLDKEAAIVSLSRRYQASRSEGYVKMAHIVADGVKENDFEKIASVCRSVTELDRINGLDVLGFDFYKEALVTKAAMLGQKVTVSLAGRTIPFTNLQKLDRQGIADLVGKDIASGVDMSDPFTTKQALEAAPRDVQLILLKACA